MKSVFQTILKALGGGLLLFLLEKGMNTTFLSEFLRGNLVTILFALLAINAATLSVVLTKIRDLMDSSNQESAFTKTKAQMLLSINEQVALIVVSILLFMSDGSPIFEGMDALSALIKISIPGCLVYSLLVLHDTCKSVFIILDYPSKN